MGCASAGGQEALQGDPDRLDLWAGAGKESPSLEGFHSCGWYLGTGDSGGPRMEGLS